MLKRFGFSKAERLKSRKQIDELFAKGKSFSVFPVKAIYIFDSTTENAGIQVGVTASKRFFKRAVDRNRIKRLLREAYRLQKEDLSLHIKASHKSAKVFFIYTDKTIADFETIKTAMYKCLQRLIKLTPIENPS